MKIGELLVIGTWVAVKAFYLKTSEKNLSYYDLITTSFFTFLFVWSALFGFGVVLESLNAVLIINRTLNNLLLNGLPFLADVYSTHQTEKVFSGQGVKKSRLYMEFVRGVIFFLTLTIANLALAMIFWGVVIGWNILTRRVLISPI